MKEVKFRVQGSAAEPYEVHFILSGKNLSAYCTCPAGGQGQYCKHRFSIMSGITNGIVSGNVNEVKEIASWVPGTDVGEIWEEVKTVEAQAEGLKKRLSVLKKKLAKTMCG